MSDHGKSRDDLAHEADLVRSKLLRTVELLDQRRHDAVDLPLQLERHFRQVAIAGGALLIATAGSVAVVVHRLTTASERRRRARWRLVRDIWRRPERILGGERRSFFGEVGRSLLLSVVTTALALPARRAVGALLEGGLRGKLNGLWSPPHPKVHPEHRPDPR